MRKLKTVLAAILLAGFGIYSLMAIVAGAPGIVATVSSHFANGQSVESLIASVDQTTHQTMPGRPQMLELHAELQNLLHKTESGGFDVVKTNDGGFANGRGTSPDLWTIEASAASLHNLQTALEEAGSDTKVIFISTQPQMIRGYTQTDSGYQIHDENPDVDAMLYYLRGYGVDYIAVRQLLRESDLLPSEYRYKTDASWTVQASFTAMQAMIGKLNDQYDAGLDPYGAYVNMDNYDVDTYENIFLGSLGRASGEPFTGKEDFTVIKPSFTTSFTYEAQGNESYAVTGGFDETLFDAEALEPYSQYEYGSLSAYLHGGAFYWRRIDNHTNQDSPKALLLHDDSALALGSFMASIFSELHMYWPAIAPNAATFDLMGYIEANDIDYVFFQAAPSGYSPYSGVFRYSASP